MREKRTKNRLAILAVLCVCALFFVVGCGNGRGSGSVDASKLNTEVPREAAVEVAEDTEREEETERTPEGYTLTITATGDCALGVTQTQSYDESFNNYYDVRGADYFLSGVRDIFEADDLTLINLECVFTTSTDRVEKEFNLKGKPNYVDILTGSSVEACSLGNNHSMDYGQEGFDDTKSTLESAGITYAYSGVSAMYVSEDGVKVGIVSANLLSQSEEKVETMKSEIRALRADGAEVIVACCHWGIEKENYPIDFQTATARAMIDAGADLVIGNHPHVIQGVEVYKGRVICYSLANFCFGANKHPYDMNTMLYQQTFTIVDGTLQTDTIDARVIPCRVSSSSDHNDFQPTVATGDRKTNILDNLNTYSAPFGTASFDAEGTLLVSE